MLSFGLLIACNLLDERLPSLSGSVTRGNLRAPEGEAGKEERRKEGRTGEARGSRRIKRAGREGEEKEMRRGQKSKSEARQTPHCTFRITLRKLLLEFQSV